MYAELDSPSGNISILPSNSKLKTLWEKGEFTEGVTVAANGEVYFSDIPSDASDSGRILKFDHSTLSGGAQTYMRVYTDLNITHI